MSDDDRRGSKRLDVELDIDLSTYGPYFLSKLKNISSGGAFIQTKELQSIGTEIKLRFRLPGEENLIEAKGKVAWVYTQPGKTRPNASGIGVQFTDISEGARLRIQDFVYKSTT